MELEITMEVNAYEFRNWLQYLEFKTWHAMT